MDTKQKALDIYNHHGLEGYIDIKDRAAVLVALSVALKIGESHGHIDGRRLGHNELLTEILEDLSKEL